MAYLMKGKHWSERDKFRKKLEYPVFVEPKIDEIRCRVSVRGSEVLFLSYAEKPLHNLQAYVDDFRRLSQWSGYTEFDCGILCNGNFNDSYRYVRSSKGLPSDLVGAPLQFYLFDLPTSHSPYEGRRIACASVASHAHTTLGLNMAVVTMYRCNTEEQVESAYTEYRKLRCEGAMVKNPRAYYQIGKRSQDWLKMKPEETADGVIVKIHQATSIVGEPLGRAGSVTVRLEDGSYATPHGIPHTLGVELWENQCKYLIEQDQWVEFAYMERDRQGGYRHPTFRRLRDAKV